MSLNLDLLNIIKLFSALSPLLVSFLLVMITILNQNLKGLIYLSGVMVTSVVNLIIGKSLDMKKYPDASLLCDFIGLPYLTDFNVPSSSVMFHAFTIVYLVCPMYATKQPNVLLITLLSLFLILDCVAKIKQRCTNYTGISTGIFLGGVMGWIWYTAIKSKDESLLYYNETSSNNVQCSRPSNQTFKCTVYKNGQVISESIA